MNLGTLRINGNTLLLLDRTAMSALARHTTRSPPTITIQMSMILLTYLPSQSVTLLATAVERPLIMNIGGLELSEMAPTSQMATTTSVLLR